MNLPATRVAEPEVSRERATEISQSKLMPEHFSNSPANVQYVMEIGRALGIDPVSALSYVHVFPDGKGRLKCSLSADLMVALARAAGHVVHVEGHQSKATAVLVRGDVTTERIELLKAMGLEPKELFVFTEVWTIERAQKAGLLNKDNWQKYPTAMLRSRAKTDVIRAGCSEVLMGLSQRLRAMGVDLSDEMDDHIAVTSARYTPDELGAETDEEGIPLRGVIHRDPAPQQVQEPVEPTPQASPSPEAKEQRAKMAKAISEYVATKKGNEVASWISGAMQDESASVKDRLDRLALIAHVCEKDGRSGETVLHEDNETTIGAVIQSHATALMNRK